MESLLQKQIPYPEFDYQTLLDLVREYAYPRQRISVLLRNGLIIRVKKGLYVLGESGRQQPYCRELLANLIYGPSYVSLEYALHYHGLIPERAEVVTSVTCGRTRTFLTPIGTFSYRTIPMAAYSNGMDRVELADGRAFLIAIPEKALADRLVAERGASLATQQEILTFLAESLRIEETVIRSLDPVRLDEIAGFYRSRRIQLLSRLVSRLRRNGTGAADA